MIRWLALTTAEIIQQKFPGRAVLTPEEVAEVWKGQVTRSSVESIRQRLKAGTLIKGLRKNGGRWEVPVADLIHAIEGLVSHQKDDPQPVARRGLSTANTVGLRKRSPLGPRLGVLDVQSFWQEVFEAIDMDDAQALRDELRRQLGID